jgi:hypothetical protein
MSVPKQLAKRRKLERKRLRKRESRARRQRDQRTFGRVPIWIDAPVGFKMSDVLSDFVAPYGDCWDDADSYRRLLTLGIVAWNAALQPPDRRQAMINDVIDNGLRTEGRHTREMCYDIVQELIARKLTDFAEYRRPILNFHLDDLGDGDFYLVVASEVSM